MRLIDDFYRRLRLLCALAEHVTRIAQQLLFPIGDLVGRHVRLLDQLSHRQITLNRRQGDQHRAVAHLAGPATREDHAVAVDIYGYSSSIGRLRKALMCL